MRTHQPSPVKQMQQNSQRKAFPVHLTITRASQYDHNDECVGCGVHVADPCGVACPFETGDFGPDTVLRAAATRLPRHRGGMGWRIHEAILAAAQDLNGSAAPFTLAAAADHALARYLGENAGPETALTGAELIHWHSAGTPIDSIAMALYAAAAQHGGYDFNPDDFGDFPR